MDFAFGTVLGFFNLATLIGLFKNNFLGFCWNKISTFGRDPYCVWYMKNSRVYVGNMVLGSTIWFLIMSSGEFIFPSGLNVSLFQTCCIVYLTQRSKQIDCMFCYCVDNVENDREIHRIFEWETYGTERVELRKWVKWSKFKVLFTEVFNYKIVLQMFGLPNSSIYLLKNYW